MAVCPDTNSTETDTILIGELTLETKPEAFSIDERVPTEEPICSRSYPSQGKYLLVSPLRSNTIGWLQISDGDSQMETERIFIKLGCGRLCQSWRNLL